MKLILILIIVFNVRAVETNQKIFKLSPELYQCIKNPDLETFKKIVESAKKKDIGDIYASVNEYQDEDYAISFDIALEKLNFRSLYQVLIWRIDSFEDQNTMEYKILCQIEDFLWQRYMDAFDKLKKHFEDQLAQLEAQSD